MIIKFLPLNVKAVLETESPKYQSLMAFSGGSIKRTPKKEEKKEDAIKIDFIENQLNKPKMTKPVVVPSAVNTKKVTKLSRPVEPKEQQAKLQETVKMEQEEQIKTQEVQKVELPQEEPVQQPKRGRGRPKKVTQETEENKVATPKRGRGRPKKVVEEVEPEEATGVNLFDLGEEEEENTVLPGLDETLNTEEAESTVLPGFDTEVEEPVETYKEPEIPNTNTYEHYRPEPETYHNEIIRQENNPQDINIESLLTRDKKIVSFVGTSKNGTTFLVNNLGELFSSMGIKTAILDMTQNKNSYYIYTKNEEELRRVAFNCMTNLEKGMPEGIKANKNLTVYTSLPTENEELNIGAILTTLVKNYALVLIDCDFNTPLPYFENAQEIYLVQSMDILTIQPLTAFLRELKAKNILVQEKMRAVINKELRIKSLNSKVIIGGMSYYNDPAMSFMTELFNKDSIRYCTIPFDEQVYAKYLEGLVNCKVSLNGYSKTFMQALKQLGNMVYPLLSNKYRPLETYQEKDTFSSQMSNTLEQMKRKF